MNPFNARLEIGPKLRPGPEGDEAVCTRLATLTISFPVKDSVRGISYSAPSLQSLVQFIGLDQLQALHDSLRSDHQEGAEQ